MERVDKLLGGTGRWTRSEARQMIKSGRVTLAGARITDPGFRLPPDAVLWVDGVSIAQEALVYLMMNKPQGVVSSTEDPRERTVLDLLPPHFRQIGLFPVGRLDKDTEGLLLLTNDGPLGHDLTAPRHHVEKVYYARVEGVLDEADVLAFSQGLTLRDGTRCRPARLELPSSPSEAIVTITEGKYHQVKRMMAARGKKVLYLKRLAMGSLHLDEGLEPGAFRRLTEEEKVNIVKKVSKVTTNSAF